MNLNYLTVPGTNQRLVDGTIVMLSRFPGMKWIVKNGWYTYNQQQLSGWYFLSIPDKTTIPVNEADMKTLCVISTNSSPYHPPYPPCPPHPVPPGPHKPVQDEILDRAMITVDNLNQRNALGDAFLPNGKIVRVNDVDGKIEYYEWDSATLTWLPASLGENYLTKDETQDLVDEALEDFYSGPEWGTLQ